MAKVLITSPIRQSSNILKEFLSSIENLTTDGLDIHYYFMDNNTELASSKLLDTFKENHPKNTIINKKDSTKNSMYKNGEHNWAGANIDEVIKCKNEFLKYANDNDFDYLFLIDSDILLDKRTLLHLISRKVDIVSNIFWTQWVKGGGFFPQVWLQDFNDFYISKHGHEYSTQEKKQLGNDFINNLKVPGLYEVGGLGACTLLSKKVLKQYKYINFSKLDNVSFWGEDRHFCIRAKTLNFNLYVDTVYPAFHIYHQELLSNVSNFKKYGFRFQDINISTSLSQKILRKIKEKKTNFKNPVRLVKEKIKILISNHYKNSRKRITNNDKIVLSMVVRNEAANYLPEMLAESKKLADFVLIIDDNSDDNTVKICEEVLSDKPHKIIKNQKSLFATEYKLRTKQWKETIKLNPGWILAMDADEFFEKSAQKTIRGLIKNNGIDLYRFRYYDMWDQDHYRNDIAWQGHKHCRPVLLRYQPHFRYSFRKTNQHCGSLPKNIALMSYSNSTLRLKHYGWSREKDRIRKYKRYKELDKNGKYGNIKQYESILDKNPNLNKFDEEEIPNLIDMGSIV